MPPKPKFPCGICDKAVTWKAPAIACNNCGIWYHKNCVNISTAVFRALEESNAEWTCCSCGLPQFHSSFFESSISDSTLDSVNSGRESPVLGQPQACSTPLPDAPDAVPKAKSVQQKNVSVLLINCQSIKNKLAEFWIIIEAAKPDIIILTETWLNSNISSSEILPPGLHYELFRRDRSDGYGGVAIAISRSFDAKHLHTADDCEALFIELNITVNKGRKESVIVGAVYRPPSSRDDYMESLCTNIRNMAQQHRKSVLWIGGDFNLPDIDWNNYVVAGHRNPLSVNNDIFTSTLEMGIEQIVTFPTRLEHTLDLFFTNRPAYINNCQSMPGIGDHDIVHIDTDIIPRRRKPSAKHKIYLWDKANMEDVRKEGERMADEFLNKYDKTSLVDEMWSSIKAELHKILDKHVPSKFTTQRFNQPWVNRKVKRLSRQKQRAYNKARSSHGPRKARMWEKFILLKRRTQKACKEAYETYINNIICPDLRSNPKRFWSYISSKRCDSNGISPLRGPTGATFTSSKDKANLLNDQFSSVFNHVDEDKETIPNLGPSPYPHLSHIDVTSNGIIKLLKKLNPHKASGPDNIPPRLLKELADILGPVLATLYQASVDTGILPEEWKSANVTPIFKKGDKSLPSNYRPISLTIICCKILEHIIHSTVMGHLDVNKILTDVQHGFRKARSCESQLILAVDDLARNIDAGVQTDAILLDFAKAFDKVPHPHLLRKLEYYGLSGSLLMWIRNFLHDRTQRVVIDGESSNVAPVTSGVPQGSVLGPLLFLVYINDLPSCVSDGTKVKLFADDTMVYRVINSHVDAVQLQQDLDALQEWERKWLMTFHPGKCQVLHISKRKKKDQNRHTYAIHGTDLKPVESAKYLGVEISSDLSFDRHIDSITRKGMKTLGFLRRNLPGRSCSKEIKTACYNTLVRPIVEYASCVWDPHTSKAISKAESVQRSAARYVMNNYSRRSSVTSMINELQWKTLQHRRAVSKVAMMYRITNHLIDIPDDQLVPLNTPTRGHSKRFLIPRSRTSLMKDTFFPNTIRLWNGLPENVVSSPSIDIFKTRVKDVGIH